jgi:hypothetical protein
MRRLLTFISIVLLSITLTACNPPPVTINTLGLPPSVNEEALDGAYESRVDNAFVEIVQKLKAAGYSAPTEYRYGIIRDGTAWQPILDYYKTALDSTWQPDDRISGQSSNYHYMGWRRGRQALIVNYVEWQPDFNIVVIMLTPT